MNNTELLLTFGAIGCVFLVLNAIFLGVISFMRARMAAVSRWHSTIGAVVNSHLERRSSDDGSTNYPVVQYSYQVSGQTYQSAKLAPGPEVGGTGAGRVVARYPVGAQVVVFYDPQNPSDAVLERKAPALWVMVFLLVVFDLALCAAVPIIWFTAAR